MRAQAGYIGTGNGGFPRGSGEDGGGGRALELESARAT